MCLKKHSQWSDFSQFDDVVPLFGREGNKVSSSRRGISRVRTQTWDFWSWIVLMFQLQVVKLMSSMYAVSRGISRMRRYFRSRVNRLRFHNRSDDSRRTHVHGSERRNNTTEVLKKDVQSEVDQPVRDQISTLGSLKMFSMVNCSPERMAKLQRQDPDIGCVVKWMSSDRQRPPRDNVAGYSPVVRNYWLSWDLLFEIKEHQTSRPKLYTMTD